MARILLVDDEDEFRSVLAKILRDAGHSVTEADNGETGLTEAFRSIPEIIVCDVHMENINGFMVIEQIRENPKTQKIPVVMMTGAATGAGAWGSDPSILYLPKPFNGQELIETINQALARSSEAR